MFRQLTRIHTMVDTTFSSNHIILPITATTEQWVTSTTQSMLGSKIADYRAAIYFGLFGFAFYPQHRLSTGTFPWLHTNRQNTLQLISDTEGLRMVLDDKQFQARLKFHLQPDDVLIYNPHRIEAWKDDSSMTPIQSQPIHPMADMEGSNELLDQVAIPVENGKYESVASIVQTIMTVLEEGKEHSYGEGVNMLQHGIQAAVQALKGEHATRDSVIASLVHDIGSCPEVAEYYESTEKMKSSKLGILGFASHEELGAKYLLAKGFSEKIARLVKGHVDAKRYLVATHDHYAECLSEASQHTLLIQGGPMTSDEITAFRHDPMYLDMLSMRNYDDLAKDPNAVMPHLHYFEPLLIDHLLEQAMILLEQK